MTLYPNQHSGSGSPLNMHCTTWNKYNAGFHKTVSTTYLCLCDFLLSFCEVVYTLNHGDLKSCCLNISWRKITVLALFNVSVQTQHWHSVSLLARLRYSVHHFPFHREQLSFIVSLKIYSPWCQQDKRNTLHTACWCLFNPALFKLTIQMQMKPRLTIFP